MRSPSFYPQRIFLTKLVSKITIVLFLLLAATNLSAQSAQLNIDAYNAYKNTDKELTLIYQKVLAEYASDTVFVHNLKASQRVWVMYREAELRLKYPDRTPGYYGDIHPVCLANYLEELTKERIKVLKQWLDGLKEEDACKGSVKTKK